MFLSPPGVPRLRCASCSRYATLLREGSGNGRKGAGLWSSRARARVMGGAGMPEKVSKVMECGASGLGICPRLPIATKCTKCRGANFITCTSEGFRGEVRARLPRHLRPEASGDVLPKSLAQRVPASKQGADCCHAVGASGDHRDKSALEDLSIHTKGALKPKVKEPKPAQPLGPAGAIVRTLDP